MASGRDIQVHPSQRLTTPGGEQVSIDTGMIPLVRPLWSLGLVTTASCQDFGEGTAGQRETSPDRGRYGGDAFIAYYAGYAWLKMPVPDARRLAELLTHTALRDKVTQRWTPGSWRMHVPLIPSGDSRIDLASTAQIHFPRDQIQEVALALATMRA
jgi:hypothetical protein